MIGLGIDHDRFILQVEDTQLYSKIESQLRFWGLELDAEHNCFKSVEDFPNELVIKICSYLDKKGYEYTIDHKLSGILLKHDQIVNDLTAAREKGSRYKEAESIYENQAAPFLKFVSEQIPRKLKDHQLKAALHMLFVGNGANFSVPGSGKTTVVLSVYQWLRKQGLVDSLFVVGPPSCFGPWKYEYKEVIGDIPDSHILAGGNVDQRHSKYYVNKDTVGDLYLTSFQTLLRDHERVYQMFRWQNVRYFLVIDEAHYIKKIDGPWANSVLTISKEAERVCILTGTPFPQSYLDAFNLFDTLWPQVPPISSRDKLLLQHHVKEGKTDRAMEILDMSIGPLFYRVRKLDLHLAPQKFNDPVLLKMNENEQKIYEAIIAKIHTLSFSDYYQNRETLQQLKRGRMIRMRQCLSHAALLKSAISEYQEDIIKNTSSLADIIMHYEDFEKPKKLEVLITMVLDLMGNGEKVVVWSNFVDTIKLIHSELQLAGLRAKYIYGGTPVQANNENETLTRECIIQEFTSQSGNIDVLIANPAACAESISLHKACSHAIYYDMSYNCSQYLQSLDRIHRVGGSENKIATYYFLQYENTLDQDILINLNRKSKNMSRIIDQDYPIYELDMFAEDEELDAYERVFGK